MGWNGSGQKGAALAQPKVTAKKPSPVRGLVAGIVVVVLAVAAYFAFFSCDEKPQKVVEEKRSAKIKEVSPQIPQRSVSVETEAEKPVAPGIEKEEKAEPKQEQPKVLFPPGRKKVHAVITNFMGSGNGVHRNATEQMLVRLFTTEVGDAPRPMGRIPPDEKKRLAEILIDKNEITEKDTEVTAMSKEILAQAKKHMIEYIKEGGQPEDFFDHYHMQLVDAFKKRMQADELLHEAIDGADDPVFAIEYCKKINEQLEKEGIKPLKLTKRERGEQ